MYIFYTDLTDEREHEYQLVQFQTEKYQTGETLEIDIIPTTWISWDEKKRVCITRYPSPPYTAKVCEQLQLVKNYESPNQCWPLWTIEIKDGASKLCKY